MSPPEAGFNDCQYKMVSTSVFLLLSHKWSGPWGLLRYSKTLNNELMRISEEWLTGCLCASLHSEVCLVGFCYFFSSSHLLIWLADKNPTARWVSLFIFLLPQPASVQTRLYFQVRRELTENVFIFSFLFFFFSLSKKYIWEAAVRQSPSVSLLVRLSSQR